MPRNELNVATTSSATNSQPKITRQLSLAELLHKRQKQEGDTTDNLMEAEIAVTVAEAESNVALETAPANPQDRKYKDKEENEESASMNMLKNEFNISRSLQEWSLTGRMGSLAESVLHHRLISLYSCLRTLKFHGKLLPTMSGMSALSEAVLGTRGVGYHHHEGMFQCAEVDAYGELFAAGDDCGIISINFVSRVLELRGEDTPCETALSIQTPSRNKIGRVRWNPWNQDELAVIHQNARSMYFYDINRTRGQPTRTLNMPHSESGGGDFRYFGGGQRYGLALGTSNGRVLLWDSRVAGAPISILRSTSTSSFSSIETLDNDRVLVGGNQSGEIKAWDLRMTGGSAVNFSALPSQHQMLASVTLTSEIAQVDGLIDQTGFIPACGIHSMSADPVTGRRVAFHLSSGWSGVFDFYDRQITHIHAPPIAEHSSRAIGPDQDYGGMMGSFGNQNDLSTVVHWWDTVEGEGAISVQVGRWLRRRSGCWLNDSTYAVPARAKNAIFIIDFSDKQSSGTRVWPMMVSHPASKAAAEVSISHEVTAVVSSSNSIGSLIALGAGGHTSIVSHSDI